MANQSNLKRLKYDDVETDPCSMKAVQEELGESEESVRRCLADIKWKLKNTAHLNPCLKDDFLILFLRVCKFDVNKTYQKVLKFYNTKKKYAQLFAFALPSCTLKVQAANSFYVLPNRAPDNSLVIVRSVKIYDPERMSYEDVFLYNSMVYQILNRNPLTQMFGITVIFDLEGLTLQMVKHMSVKKWIMMSEFKDASPGRYKAFHIVNCFGLAHYVQAFVSMFFSKKMKNRILFYSIHDNLERLHSSLPPEILPKKYGGHIDMRDAIDASELLNNAEDYFLEQLQYGYTSKR